MEIQQICTHHLIKYSELINCDQEKVRYLSINQLIDRLWLTNNQSKNFCQVTAPVKWYNIHKRLVNVLKI